VRYRLGEGTGEEGRMESVWEWMTIDDETKALSGLGRALGTRCGLWTVQVGPS
jgi:hypothetical protein